MIPTYYVINLCDPTRDIKEITMNPDLTVKFFIICFAELARGFNGYYLIGFAMYDIQFLSMFCMHLSSCWVLHDMLPSKPTPAQISTK